MDKTVSLAPPWIVYKQKITLLFGKDPDINITWDAKSYRLTLNVKDRAKAEAIAQLLPPDKQFGNVTLIINVSYKEKSPSEYELFKNAFAGNPILSFIEKDDDVPFASRTYVVFKKEIAQYYADDLGDPHGVRSTLYENVARDVLLDFGEGVSFTTEIVGKTISENRIRD